MASSQTPNTHTDRLILHQSVTTQTLFQATPPPLIIPNSNSASYHSRNPSYTSTTS
ncbi:unnamed protein product, partial [Dovyalis caffra]